jgi:hypothetical protein
MRQVGSVQVPSEAFMSVLRETDLAALLSISVCEKNADTVILVSLISPGTGRTIISGASAEIEYHPNCIR